MPTKRRYTLSRREFVAGAIGITAGMALTGKFSPVVPFLRRKWRSIPGEIVGGPSKIGHLLRGNQLPAPSEHRTTEFLIIGGGIAGLSAAWWLQKQKIKDFQLLELDEEVGGNSRWGSNSVSSYPWGAHYVPIPSPDSKLLIQLFEDLGIIEGKDLSGLPIYNELYLSNDPQERVFAQGHWQEGVVPKSVLTSNDQDQLASFLAKMDFFRKSRGADGKRLFSIPIDESSNDLAIRALDKVSMLDFMEQNGWSSAQLRWYVDYCCRDDYGAGIGTVSAWAGIHYFASRDGKGANTVKGNVLTWPEGNGWIVKQLKSRFSTQIQSSSLVFNVSTNNHGPFADFFDVVTKKVTRVAAKAIIFAAPRFVAAHVVEPLRRLTPEYLSSLHYSPWMVANLTLNRPLESPHHAPLSWDNVLYGSRSLGYVNAGHQKIQRYPRETVLTYYQPLSELSPSEARQSAMSKTHRQWTNEILEDLSSAHPNLSDQLSRVDIWLWGHGMIRPTVGYIWGENRQKMLDPIGSIFFAHTDMSGVSIFEEAQYQGVQAAKLALNRLQRSK